MEKRLLRMTRGVVPSSLTMLILSMVGCCGVVNWQAVPIKVRVVVGTNMEWGGGNAAASCGVEQYARWRGLLGLADGLLSSLVVSFEAQTILFTHEEQCG